MQMARYRICQERLSPFINQINDKVDDEIALGLVVGTISDHLPVYLKRMAIKPSTR